MRIALFSGGVIYPLAGAAGVSERTHSSAGEFEITGQSAVQVAAFLRAAYAKPIDKGNLLQVLSFTTTRQFATPAEAEIWALDYATNFPSSGALYLDAVSPSGAITRRILADAVVDPPLRRTIGATAFLTYQVRGSSISAQTFTGNMVVSGHSFAAANGVYTLSGTQSGRPFYVNGLHIIMWVNTSGGYWGLSPTGTWSARSASNVATPDLATGWFRADTLVAVPSLSIVPQVA
jgi:hypothetical protein